MFLTGLLLLGLALEPSSKKSISDYTEDIATMNESTNWTSRERARRIPDRYLNGISKLQEDRSLMSNDDLHKLFAVTGMAFFYAQFSAPGHQKKILGDLEKGLGELETRRDASDSEVAEVYQGLISLRDFGKARKVFDAHPDSGLVDIPAIAQAPTFNSKLPSVYRLSVDGKGLYLHNMDARHGNLIVVVAQCHFARDAALQISNDPELLEAFKKGNVVWLQSSSQPLSAVDLKEWNELFPDFPLSTAYDDGAWMDVDFFSSPGFFFFKDGKLLSHRDGWSTTKSKEGLNQSLRQLGISASKD